VFLVYILEVFIPLSDQDRMLKQKLVECKGGRCVNCGYNKCIAALEFHHKDPSLKEFNINNKGTYTYDKLLKEVDKCTLLCSNCHKELHYYNQYDLRTGKS
jgi:hypothetical protein